MAPADNTRYLVAAAQRRRTDTFDRAQRIKTERAQNDVNRPGVSGHFTSFESESERHVIIEAVKQLSARVA